MNKIANGFGHLEFRPRVRLTAFCNRRCSYCFAKDYLSEKDVHNEIDINSMEKILCNCSKEKIQCIGWQGGEPTLHTNIDSIIKLHEKYGIKAMVFTNGLIRREIIENMSGIVEAVLVNCNEPNTYQNEELSQLFANIKLMKALYGEGRVAIGINIYSDKMDTSFILDYAMKTGIKEVRIDITRPSPSNGNVFVDYDSIKKVFSKAKETHKILLGGGVKYAHFDCPFPLCAISREDADYLWNYMDGDLGYAQCSTALDITPDFNIASCFCSMQFKNINVDRFDSLTHAWLFIKYLEDEIKWSVYTKDSCVGCENNIKKVCQGGCLGYKPGIDKVFNEEKLFDKCELLNRAGDIAKLYVLYKNQNYLDSYNLANQYLQDEKYKYNDAVKEIQILSAIYLKKYKTFEKEIIKMIKESVYPSLEAYLFASALYDDSLDFSIEIAELGLLLDDTKARYHLHYLLYEAFKQKGMKEKAYRHFASYYTYLPDMKKLKK